MKIRYLLLPVLLLLSSCSCDLTIKSINAINVEVSEKERKTDQNFDLDDVTAQLVYGESNVRNIQYKDFEVNHLSVSCEFPDGTSISEVQSDFKLTTVGTYTLFVNYTPVSKYSFPCTGSASFDVVENIIPATSLTIGSDSLTIKKGYTSQITYSILPVDSTTKTPTFTSSDTNVASVDGDGVVTAIDEGQCIIKAKADNITKECLITVLPTNDATYVFNTLEFTSPNGDWGYDIPGTNFGGRQNRGVQVKEETTITSPISYNSVSKISIECFSGSASILGTSETNCGTIETSVNDVLVKSNKLVGVNNSFLIENLCDNLSGEVKLHITPQDTKIYIRSITITYEVDTIYPTSISLSGNNTVGIGDSDKLSISYTPVDTSQRIIEWSSSNESILTVARDGTVTGVSEGTAIVTARAKTENDYVSDTFELTIIKIPVQSISLNASSLEVYEEKTFNLTSTITPANASNKNVTYESSNTNVATVDANGCITGVKLGECTITCRSADDPTIIAQCNVTVLEKPALASNYMSSTFNDYTNLNYYTIDSAPSVGNVKLLVIPVWFSDSNKYISNKDNVKEDIQKVYFGTTDDTGWQSVKTFYETEADGRLNFTGTVSDWYECGKSWTTYNYDSGSSNTSTTTLVKNATDWYFAKNTSDSRKNYDCDGDGYLDGVIIIYGCPDYSALESNNTIFSSTSYGDNLWAYTFWLQNKSLKSTLNPGPNSFFWASYDFMYNSSTALSRTGKSSYASGQNSSKAKLDSHTFIHEMGHVFGLEDYYDYSNYYKPAGGFSMQDYNVGGHDPFSCLALGWAKAYIPYEDCEIKINSFQSSHEVILLTPSMNAYNSPFDEYLLIELYTPTGLNKFDTDYSYSSSHPRGVNATGIRLWHVDARLIKYSLSGTIDANTTYDHPVDRCKLMMSNTYYSSSTTSYISPLGRSYANYNLLQLIRNNTTSTYQPNDNLREASLFKSGSTFTMNTYKKQFVNAGYLNSGKSLGWKFFVSITGTNDNAEATIKVTKV